MPSLSERIEDVPDLARFLVAKIGKMQGRELRITDSALRVLMRHDWPGNVRELENCLERAAVMSEQGVIDRDVIQLAGLNVGAADSDAPMPVAKSRARSGRSELWTSASVSSPPGRSRLGAGQGGAVAQHDPAPDRLPHSDAEDQGPADLIWTVSLSCSHRPSDRDRIRAYRTRDHLPFIIR